MILSACHSGYDTRVHCSDCRRNHTFCSLDVPKDGRTFRPMPLTGYRKRLNQWYVSPPSTASTPHPPPLSSVSSPSSCRPTTAIQLRHRGITAGDHSGGWIRHLEERKTNTVTLRCRENDARCECDTWRTKSSDMLHLVEWDASN